MRKRAVVFADFDGTIAVNDVGDNLFASFSKDGWRKHVQAWKDGKLSSKECFEKCLELTEASKEQINSFCDSQPLDPYFKDFVQFCEANQIPITIISDGLDYYINRIMEKHGLGHLPVISNQLIFENENKLRPEFPYFGLGCPSCANCKGIHVKKTHPDDLVVYIGDGYSDRCGVGKADLVFAKSELETYCKNNKIPFVSYNNFRNVLSSLKNIL